MNISIDSTNGKTLLTQGKYCAENIVVTPVLATVTVTSGVTAQSFSALDGTAGFSTVTVTPDGYNNGVSYGSSTTEYRIESILKTL